MPLLYIYHPKPVQGNKTRKTPAECPYKPAPIPSGMSGGGAALAPVGAEPSAA